MEKRKRASGMAIPGFADINGADHWQRCPGVVTHAAKPRVSESINQIASLLTVFHPSPKASLHLQGSRRRYGSCPCLTIHPGEGRSQTSSVFPTVVSVLGRGRAFLMIDKILHQCAMSSTAATILLQPQLVEEEDR